LRSTSDGQGTVFIDITGEIDTAAAAAEFGDLAQALLALDAFRVLWMGVAEVSLLDADGERCPGRDWMMMPRAPAAERRCCAACPRQRHGCSISRTLTVVWSIIEARWRYELGLGWLCPCSAGSARAR
jgi:hypothetical protein